MPTRSPVYLALVLLSVGLFAAGVLGNLLFWLQGGRRKDEHPVGAGFKPALTGLFFLAGAGLGGVARVSVWQSLLLDTLLQRRLWRLSRLRWLMHIGFIWGMAELFLGGVVDIWIDRGIVHLTKDTPVLALLNELGTVLVLLGVAIALYRRFVAKEVALPTSFGDASVIFLLATILLSGIFVEAVRLLSDGVPAEVGWYSFTGYALASVIRPLSPNWSGIYAPAWWLHTVMSFSFVAYLPYSKLFHMFMGPVVLAAGAAER